MCAGCRVIRYRTHLLLELQTLFESSQQCGFIDHPEWSATVTHRQIRSVSSFLVSHYGAMDVGYDVVSVRNYYVGTYRKFSLGTDIH